MFPGFLAVGVGFLLSEFWCGGLALILLVLAISGLLLYDYLFKCERVRRIRFDKPSQEMTIEKRFGKYRDHRTVETRPLSSIVGVQVLYTGYYSSYHNDTMQAYHTYEMNLVLDDGTRFHLCAHSDWEWFRREGRRLAEFLQVPVIDQLSGV